MPHPTIPNAFLQLTEVGIPWGFPAWQDATGVTHGLFPDDPTDRPKGWTEEDLANIKSLFSRYRALRSDEKKTNFLRDNNANVLPGRQKWKQWANAIWRSSKSQSKIIAVFTAQNCHPYTRSLAALKATGETKESRITASGTQWIPLCLDAIAIALYGDECLDEDGFLPETYRIPTQALAQRTWVSLLKRIDRTLVRLPGLEENARDAFHSLDKAKITKTAISTVIRAVAKWRNAVEVIQSAEDLAKLEDMEAELGRLMEGVGAEVDSEVKKTRKSKSPAPPLFSASSDMLRSLASDQAIQDAIALYHEYFGASSNAVDDVPVIQLRSLAGAFDESTEGADIGTEYEATKSRQVLANNLGFIEELPLLFNTTRHTAGLTRWTSFEAFQIEPGAPVPPEIRNLNLHWHQLAGVHAILRACFTSESRPDHCPGIVVADEVGLGKTYQSAAVIACLADAVTKQKEKLPAAPLLQARPYLAGSADIPSLPHLILVPGTLLSQWFDELRILFQPGGVDLFVYPTAQKHRAAFWDAEGPFHSSKHSLSNRIVLASHSAMTTDYNALYQPMPRYKPQDLPWTIPPLRTGKTCPDISTTLFGQKYLSVVVDEAHNFRNHGPKHLAALAILQNTIIRLPLTATPLQTSPKDLAAMGRLTGLAHFFTPEAYDEEKEDIRAVRRARKEKQDAGDTVDDKEQDDPVKQCQHEIARRMQRQSEGHILRRTTASRNFRGEELVPLPPCETFYAFLDLTPRELAIISANAKEMEDMIGTANLSNKIITRGFYIEYRLSLVFATSNPKAPLPKITSLEQWAKIKSTKLDMAARLAQYFLTRDDLPLPTFANGGITFPAIPPVKKGEKISKDCKIVVFSEFPSMLPVLIQVFKLHGVEVLAINGSMSFEKRAATVKKFRESSVYRVIVLSSVGTIGMNFSFCYIMIFLDQPWSSQDVHQMRGRVHRQPQKHKVTCIHLLANDTSDIIVDGMARGKRDMMDVFLSKDAGKGLFQLLTADADIDPDEEPPTINPEQSSSEKQSGSSTVKPTLSKGKSKARQEEYTDGDEDEEDQVAVSIAPGEELVDNSDVDSRAPSKAPPVAPRCGTSASQMKKSATKGVQDSSQQKRKPSATKPPSQRQPPKGNSKPAPIAVDSDTQPRRRIPNPHASEDDFDSDAPLQRRARKSKTSASKLDADTTTPHQSSNANARPPRDEEDSDAPPRQRHSQSKPKSLTSRTKPSANSDANELNSDAPSLHRPSKPKARAPPIQDDLDAPSPPRPSKVKAKRPSPIESDSETAPQHHTSKGKARRTPSNGDNEECDQHGAHFEAEQGDGGCSTPDDDGADYEDDVGPAETDISSSKSTRPSSRASDVSMDDKRHGSDSSMCDIAYGQDFASGKVDNLSDDEDSDDVRKKRGRKRLVMQMASPPSPTAHRDTRRRMSGEFNDYDDVFPTLLSFSNRSLQTAEAQMTQASSTRQKPPSSLPPASQTNSSRHPPQQKQISAVAQGKQKQPTRPTRNPAETLALLVGKSGNAAQPAAGPSSAPTSSTGRSAPLKSASSSRSTSEIRGSASTRSTPTIPTHRVPSAFQVITPPPPLAPAKNKNPFPRRADKNDKRR